MRNLDIARWWKAFLRWNGWKAIGVFWVKIWNATIRWTGWRVVFGIPFTMVLLMCAASTVGLVWIFVNGFEKHLLSCLLYPVSAYSLIALCFGIPNFLKDVKIWIARHPWLTAVLNNEELQFNADLYLEQLINFAYGIFKIVSGVVIGSAWIGCDGIYNMAQSLIQLFQILRRRNPGPILRQWKSYRFCGVLILLMHLTLTGIVFQMIQWNRAEEMGQIQVIATAAFAFYKLTNSFISIARDRKHTHPVDSSIRMLNLGQAIFAIFSLQASMFHTFGTGEPWERLMNIFTGCTVCALIASMGIYMIRRGTREIIKLQETEYGR